MADSRSVIPVGETFDALVLFTDIARFDAFARSREPQRIAVLIRTYAQIHHRILGCSAGCLIKRIVDASLIVFPSEQVDTGVRILLQLYETLKRELNTTE